MREIIQDRKPHFVGEREVVNWTRPNGTPHGQRFENVPLVYLREVTAEDYLAQFPHMRGQSSLAGMYFWEVSVD